MSKTSKFPWRSRCRLRTVSALSFTPVILMGIKYVQTLIAYSYHM